MSVYICNCVSVCISVHVNKNDKYCYKLHDLVKLYIWICHLHDITIGNYYYSIHSIDVIISFIIMYNRIY